MTAVRAWLGGCLRGTKVPRWVVVLVATVLVVIVSASLLGNRDSGRRYTQAQRDCYVNAPTQADADACIVEVGR